MDHDKLTLHAIGEFSDSTITLDAAYKGGLLHLDKFSHANLLYVHNDALYCRVIAVVRADAKSGVVETQKCAIPDGSAVFDIKPYFPCEDYVRECTVPAKRPAAIAAVNDTEISPSGKIVRRRGEYIVSLSGQDAAEVVGANCSHIKIFWWFHRFDKPEYRRVTQCNPPYENAPRTGVFASRSPVRPNPVAMTTARVLGLSGNEIRVTTLDCFEGTPLIGVVAYNPKTDRVEGASVPQWLAHWPWHIDDSDYKTGEIVLRPSAVSVMIENANLNKNSAESIFKSAGGDEPARKISALCVRGARQNNLKSIDVEIPYGKITAVTGVSGSGKSSLAFDTIYTECRRRYLDANGDDLAGARPAFDTMDGVIPAIAVSQRSIARNPRSTVGTVTNMTGLLRVLFASIGTRYCPDCGEALLPMSEDEILALLKPFEQVAVTTLEGERVGGELTCAVREALARGNGACYASIRGGEPLLLQTRQMCFHCGRIMFAMKPSDFSFNDPESMCPVCGGRGETPGIDAALLVSDEDISLLDGASIFYGKLRSFQKSPSHNWMKGEVFALAADMKVDLELPWRELPEDFRHQLLYGSNGRKVTLRITNSKIGRNGETTRPAEGLFNIVSRLYSQRSDSSLGAFVRQTLCPACHGERLNRAGRMVSVAGLRFPEAAALPVRRAREWCGSLATKLSAAQFKSVENILRSLYRNLCGFIDLGLDYLTLDRAIPTLSGGELQRVKLVCQLCGDISGVLYVFDEPSAGLHPHDYENLISTIRHIRDKGNTVVFVEHNRELITIADRIIDIGPKAGEEGGYLVYEGSPKKIGATGSETAKYLAGGIAIDPAGGANIDHAKRVRVYGARLHNLKGIDCEFPAGAISCVTGVSGSGKSSLVKGVLYPAISGIIEKSGMHADCGNIENAQIFSRIVLADQTPIGRSPRSVPATYMGIMDELRRIFASLPPAKKASLGAGHFSFNSPLGQCDHCGGDGMVSAPYLDDVWISCPVCGGSRYKSRILEILYEGKNISQILEMCVSEALGFFEANAALKSILGTLDDVGLGYLKLGQNSATLSGGEAQRLKLAKQLCAAQNGGTLYLLDEPTSGLHGSDIAHLFVLLSKLAQSGNTVVIVEHNIDIIRCADWVIDLGPGGGDAGGSLLAMGTPAMIAGCKESFTGEHLRQSGVSA